MTAASTPGPAAGSGLPILGQLSPVGRAFLIGTVAVSLLAIVLDFGLHVDETVLFLVSAAGILGLAWVVGLSTERLGSLTGPAGRRHPQCDLRQHRRADHRLLRAPGRADRCRQGVDHGLDHRQPAARARRERAVRRAPPRHADVQPAHRRLERGAPGGGGDRPVRAGRLRVLQRSRPGDADRGVGPRVRSR